MASLTSYSASCLAGLIMQTGQTVRYGAEAQSSHVRPRVKVAASHRHTSIGVPRTHVTLYPANPARDTSYLPDIITMRFAVRKMSSCVQFWVV